MTVVLPGEHARHQELMRVALARAARGLGRTRPNPSVGAVVAQHGQVVGVGHTQPAGQAHAEVVALNAAGPRARGADLYVTLEPCAHFGRTPPCVDAVVAAGVSRVFVATRDVNPHVSGGGVERLRAAGITVEVGLCQEKAQDSLAAFFHWVKTGRPLVTLKAALSLDGRLATATGDSQGLSGAAAQAWSMRLRDRTDAIAVGVGTIIRDDPRLTNRRPPLRAKPPHGYVRVVLDTHARTPLYARVFEDVAQSPVWIAVGPHAAKECVDALQQQGAHVLQGPLEGAHVSLPWVMGSLGARGITHLVVEGGSQIHGALLRHELAQRAALVITPRILGHCGYPLALWEGPASLARAISLRGMRPRQLGRDVLLEGNMEYAP